MTNTHNLSDIAGFVELLWVIVSSIKGNLAEKIIFVLHIKGDGKTRGQWPFRSAGKRAMMRKFTQPRAWAKCNGGDWGNFSTLWSVLWRLFYYLGGQPWLLRPKQLKEATLSHSHDSVCTETAACTRPLSPSLPLVFFHKILGREDLHSHDHCQRP